jgi:hypothetical protein
MLYLRSALLVAILTATASAIPASRADEAALTADDNTPHQRIAFFNSPPTPPKDHDRPTVKRGPRGRALLPRGAVMLGGVPTSTWTYGCAATAAGMMFGYYDRHGYPDMYTGPANGGVAPLINLGQGSDPNNPIPGSCSLIATMDGFDGRTTPGHVDDYWIETMAPGPDPWVAGGVEHEWSECLADFLGTNQWKWSDIWGYQFNHDGATALPLADQPYPEHDAKTPELWGLPQTSACFGLRLFAESRGYVVTVNYCHSTDTQWPTGFTFDQFRAEIDAGFPVMIDLVDDENNHHLVLGIGYELSTQTVFIHDTWDNSVHYMTWTGTYAGYEVNLVYVFHLETVDCNTNGVFDGADISFGTSLDCNANGVPDECDITDGTSEDVNGNEVPDECEPDCNNNGVPDEHDIATGASVDSDGNGIPDECEDCNENGIPDYLDVQSGYSFDADGNGIPDECQFIWYVSVNAGPDGDGTTWDTAFDTIQEGVDAATDGDTIIVADGTYAGDGNTDILCEGKNVVVQSLNGPEVCILDCAGTSSDPHRGFTLGPTLGGVCEISGFTIRNGYETYGGGIYCEASSPKIRDCIFEACVASYGGGGFYSNGAEPTLINCAWSNNMAYYMGGGLCNENSRTTIRNCTFTGNAATGLPGCQPDGGGGIYNMMDSVLSASRCSFLENAAPRGGALFSNSSSITLANCCFVANESAQSGYPHGGGGLYIKGLSVLTASDCEFTENGAAWGGGGLFVTESTATLTRCELNGNTGGVGGGMYAYVGTTLQAVNCMFRNNSSIYGGGLSSTMSVDEVMGCVFAGNTASEQGGAYFLWEGVTMMAGCSIYGNLASATGGGLGITNGTALGASNCIIWGNEAPGGGHQMWNIDSSCSVSYSCIQGGWAGTGNIDTDPLFFDDSAADFRLAMGSPCIDAGDNTAVLADVADLDGDGDTNEPTPLDLAGLARFWDDPNTPDAGNGTPPLVDMGAYEYQLATGDSDLDGDVDLHDFAQFQACFGTTDVPSLARFDFDGNGHIDIADFANFESILVGP